MDNFCNGCRKEENQNNIRGSYFIEDLGAKTPKTVIDIKLSSKDFIVQRTNNVYDIYEKICSLGKGAYGSVYKVSRKNSGTRLIIRALKEISKESMNVNPENEEEIRNKIEILKNIDHPNIMKIFEFFEDDKNIYLINEFCGGGDIAHIHDKYRLFPEFF